MATQPPRTRALTRATVVEVVTTIEAALSQARDEVDALNVFPVPDGDTGTNLVMTVRSALAEVSDDAGPATRIHQLGHGCVRGARGNSGVIFSQVVRALLESVGDDPWTTGDFASFLHQARDLSYAAVGDPQPGTILTALDAAVDAADWAVAEDLRLPPALEVVTDTVALAVARTRDVLSANREAGVVDAGARGLEVALLALRAHLSGEDLPTRPPPVRRAPATGPIVRESGSLEYDYEVQYLLMADDDVAPALRTALGEIGDSVVVVACGGLLNVHVHTNRIDEAVAAGKQHGTTDRVEVHAFADQMDTPTVESGPPRLAVGHVAVLPSAALADLVAGPGLQVVVGGPGRLPNVADLLAAAGRCNAQDVVVLPGHRNAVPTAVQAAKVSLAEEGPDLHVAAAATSAPAVLAALAVSDLHVLDLDLLEEVAKEVHVAEVVPAVRAATTPVGPVDAGELLVVVDHDVVAASHDPAVARTAALDRLLADGGELVTLLAGAATDQPERDAWVAQVHERLPAAEVQLLAAELPTSRWLVAAEGVPVRNGVDVP